MATGTGSLSPACRGTNGAVVSFRFVSCPPFPRRLRKNKGEKREKAADADADAERWLAGCVSPGDTGPRAQCKCMQYRIAAGLRFVAAVLKTSVDKSQIGFQKDVGSHAWVEQPSIHDVLRRLRVYFSYNVSRGNCFPLVGGYTYFVLWYTYLATSALPAVLFNNPTLRFRTSA